MISTKNLQLLPDINDLKKLCQSLAALDAIISPDWEDRYFSFNATWDTNESMGSMRNGEGDEYLILFNNFGAVINGYATESVIASWSNTQKESLKTLFEGLPKEFSEFINGEPVASVGTTFCIWKGYGHAKWSTGKLKHPEDEYGDGSADLLMMLDGKPSTYHEWAQEYYDLKLPLKAITSIYNFNKLTEELLDALNPEHPDIDELIEDLKEIGYPHGL